MGFCLPAGIKSVNQHVLVGKIRILHKLENLG